ncbi:MAG: hypothetical protein ACYC19_03200 [Acidimicrobiales bacterium]
MSPPTWDEYLAEASAHLAAVRATSELGAPPPNPPARPEGPPPEDRLEHVRSLALGYDQLALELLTRMQAMDQRRPLAPSKNPHQELLPARYINTPI